jgi:hypothetical protein
MAKSKGILVEVSLREGTSLPEIEGKIADRVGSLADVLSVESVTVMEDADPSDGLAEEDVDLVSYGTIEDLGEAENSFGPGADLPTDED